MIEPTDAETADVADARQLIDDVLLLKKTGIEIAALVKSSRAIRDRIAGGIEYNGLGPINSEQPIEFLIDELVVSVIKEKGGSDCTVTFKELPRINPE